ncbi:hypothetical protein V5799_016362 [Amblyomma americanum]|uniref:Uncharacterized protein n=1 Tax=Amblyomma americanum TaxID=6943 RepID=A0AAQ4F5B4_AMBAM
MCTHACLASTAHQQLRWMFDGVRYGSFIRYTLETETENKTSDASDAFCRWRGRRFAEEIVSAIKYQKFRFSRSVDLTC